jgi:SAM-dependent methyltransferase
MSVYERILGHPFVYNRIRPLMVGGIDMSAFYRGTGIGAGDVVLDIGCGTGDALRYLTGFTSYLGLDTDARAIRFANEQHGTVARATFRCAPCTDRELAEVRPTHVIMSGLLHHLADAEAVELLRLATCSPRLVRVATVDPVYLPRHPVNNLITSLDRGRHARNEAGYTALVRTAGLRLVATAVLRSHPTRGIVKYFTMTLEP